MAALKLTFLLAVVNVSLLESLPHHHQQAMMTYRDILREEWSAFKQLYRKQYPAHHEEQFRFQVFLENKHAIAVHNQAAARGQKSYTMELNHYGDLLQEEFVDLMNGFRPSKSKKSSGRTLFLTPRNMNLPGSIDWREHNLVTAVKDQGECGSCWAFSATGALEGQHSRASGQLVELSEQNLVDCVHYPGTNETYGCDGGTMDGAFEYVKSNGGIDTEQSYPYEHVLGVCRFNKTNIGATDAGEVDIPSGDEAKLQEAIASVGPISVAIDAGQPGFQHYKEGVFDEPSCNNAKEQLNHGVLVVGYGTDATSGKDYWLVKNSWSSGWGDAGYVKMVRNKDNQCGIATSASYPLV